MVILETAAIGAAGYGIYRGGDAVHRKGKEAVKEHKRERNRASQRNDLAQKAKERKDRLSQLVTMRSSGGGGGGGETTTSTTTNSFSSSTRTTSTDSSSSSSVLERMRAEHGKTSSSNGGGRFKGLFKKK